MGELAGMPGRARSLTWVGVGLVCLASAATPFNATDFFGGGVPVKALTKFERLEPDEAANIAAMTGLLKHKMERDYPVGDTRRDAHPKHLGLLKAEFVIEPNLPSALAVGVFASPKTFEAWVRFSSASGTVQSDAIKDSRGCAIKLLDVVGCHIGASDEPTTQDFLLMNIPTMPLGTIQLFHDAVQAALKGSPWVFAAKLLLTGKFQRVWALSRARITPPSPADIRYWSTTPYLLGAQQTVKYSLVPTSAYRSEMPAKLTASYLSDNLEKHLAKADATFDFVVQLNTDSASMPIEDAGVEWPESKAPFVKVATLRIPQQSFRNPARDELAEVLFFSPAHALVEHRPIGGVNRARMAIYQTLSDFRHQRDHRGR